MLSVLPLLSWGPVGHRTIATIAYNHLTPRAKTGIRKLIGDTSLADVSTWADEVRSANPAFASTAPWHYINLLPGHYNYRQFTAAVKSAPGPNLYTALQKCVADIKSDTTSSRYRVIAFKFLVHLVGDAHQPMHVSHAEDQGGNKILVRLFGYPTNLHSVWDGGLLRQYPMSIEAYTTEWDRAKPKQVAAWQRDDMIKWLYESFLISGHIYKEVAKDYDLKDKFYRQNMPVVQKRVEQGGIRLAGVLNGLFK